MNNYNKYIKYKKKYIESTSSNVIVIYIKNEKLNLNNVESYLKSTLDYLKSHSIIISFETNEYTTMYIISYTLNDTIPALTVTLYTEIISNLIDYYNRFKQYYTITDPNSVRYFHQRMQALHQFIIVILYSLLVESDFENNLDLFFTNVKKYIPTTPIKILVGASNKFQHDLTRFHTNNNDYHDYFMFVDKVMSHENQAKMLTITDTMLHKITTLATDQKYYNIIDEIHLDRNTSYLIEEELYFNSATKLLKPNGKLIFTDIPKNNICVYGRASIYNLSSDTLFIRMFPSNKTIILTDIGLEYDDTTESLNVKDMDKLYNYQPFDRHFTNLHIKILNPQKDYKEVKINITIEHFCNFYEKKYPKFHITYDEWSLTDYKYPVPLLFDIPFLSMQTENICRDYREIHKKYDSIDTFKKAYILYRIPFLISLSSNNYIFRSWDKTKKLSKSDIKAIIKHLIVDKTCQDEYEYLVTTIVNEKLLKNKKDILKYIEQLDAAIQEHITDEVKTNTIIAQLNFDISYLINKQFDDIDIEDQLNIKIDIYKKQLHYARILWFKTDDLKQKSSLLKKK